jgi:hypothetical protein
MLINSSLILYGEDHVEFATILANLSGILRVLGEY